jgi:hypothetical protein
LKYGIIRIHDHKWGFTAHRRHKPKSRHKMPYPGGSTI